MRKLSMLFMLLSVAAVQSAFANHYASFYVLPIAGHTAGANGTEWVSDVAIQNFQATPLTISLVFIQAGDATFDNVAPLTSVTIPARGSALLRDVVKDFRGLSNVTGAIMAGADKPFAITSRAFNATSGVGQEVPPFRDFLDNTLGTTDTAAAVAYVPGIVSNATSRSNIGFVAGTGNGSAAMTISVTLRDAAGAVLAGRNFVIPAGGALEQLQVGVSSLTPTPFDIGSAEFRIISGNGTVVPYASVIDNKTADGVFVAGTFPPNAAVSGKTALFSPFEAAFYRFAQ